MGIGKITDLKNQVRGVRGVRVGIMVAHNPLHRSGRAALLNPALGLGNNAKAFPRIGMTDARLRKPSSNMALHASPRQVSFLAAPFKDAPPNPAYGLSKITDRYRIHRHAMVAHIATHHRAQIPPHFGDGLVHALPKFGFHLP